MKRILLLVLCVFCISACVPVVLVAAGATVGGALVYDKRDVKTMAKDRDVASNILKQINDDPDLQKGTHITIATFNNVMLVTGQAETEEQRTRVYQMASSASNLKRIYNEISIGAPTSAAVRANDAWITTKAKSLMLAEKGLHSGQIKVVTENKVLYLMGVVTRKQADIATDVGSSVSGVEKVVRIFEYES